MVRYNEIDLKGFLRDISLMTGDDFNTSNTIFLTCAQGDKVSKRKLTKALIERAELCDAIDNCEQALQDAEAYFLSSEQEKQEANRQAKLLQMEERRIAREQAREKEKELAQVEKARQKEERRIAREQERKLIQEEKKRAQQEKQDRENTERGYELIYNDKGEIDDSIENVVTYLRNAPELKGKIRYNDWKKHAERYDEKLGKFRRWTDSDDFYIHMITERDTKIKRPGAIDKGLGLYLTEVTYNPLKDKITGIKWDGTSRIYDALNYWLHVEDNEYTRELSRLIFAGGVNRLFNPGCKFDEMVVLIGTHQGEGKSTFIRYLALDDEFFTEVNEIEGQKGHEAVVGSWICEMSELLALTKAQYVEAIKSFITSTVDKFRPAYGKNTVEYARTCIFIGTTNKEQFLTDTTGNRRFLPVKVGVPEKDMHIAKREKEAKEYFAQCWAEAYHLFQKGELYPMFNHNLLTYAQEAQEDAFEHDTDEGAFEAYAASKIIGARPGTEITVNVREIAREVLNVTRSNRYISSKIIATMNKCPGWVRGNGGKRKDLHNGDGKQYYWVYSVPSEVEPLNKQEAIELAQEHAGEDMPF